MVTLTSSSGKTKSNHNEKNKKKVPVVHEFDSSNYEIHLESASSSNSGSGSGGGGEEGMEIDSAFSRNSITSHNTSGSRTDSRWTNNRVKNILRSISGGSGGSVSSDCSSNSSNNNSNNSSSSPMSPILRRLSSSMPVPSTSPPPGATSQESTSSPVIEQADSPISRYRRELSNNDCDDGDENASKNGNGGIMDHGEEEAGHEVLLTMNGSETLCYSDDLAVGDEGGNNALFAFSSSSNPTSREAHLDAPSHSSTTSDSATSISRDNNNDCNRKNRKKTKKRRQQQENSSLTLDSRIAVEMEAAKKAASSVVESDLTDEAVHQLVLQALQQYQADGDSQAQTPPPPKYILSKNQHQQTPVPEGPVKKSRSNSLEMSSLVDDEETEDDDDDEDDDGDDDDGKLLLPNLETPHDSLQDVLPEPVSRSFPPSKNQPHDNILPPNMQEDQPSLVPPTPLQPNNHQKVSKGHSDEKKESAEKGVTSVPVVPPRSSDPILQARDPGKRARFSAAPIASPTSTPGTDYTRMTALSPTPSADEALNACISATESDVGSVDGLPLRLRARWEAAGRENLMQSLDGLHVTSKACGTPRIRSRAQAQPDTIIHSRSSVDQLRMAPIAEKSNRNSFDEQPLGFFSSWPLVLLFGSDNGSDTQFSKDEADEYDRKRRNDQDVTTQMKSRWKDEDDTLALLACSNIIHPACVGGSCYRAPVVPTSLVRVTSEPPLPSYVEALNEATVDPRMQVWVDNQFTSCDRPAKDGTYRLGKSRTVLVHEIVRGNWTWCTAWSPDGSRLAVATENHHLAIIDTTCSPVWRVRHDRKIKSPASASGGTQALRSIAWGTHFIAVGGTGNAVSILAPIEPYPVLHTIQGTGFVGSLDWKADSSDLVIGSRLDRATIVRIKAQGDAQDDKQIDSEILHTIEMKNWVHSVAFSPRGRCLAIGDAGGNLLVYNYLDEFNKEVELSPIQAFRIDDAVLEVEWSPDGQWLYAGGEDFRVTVIETRSWEIVHRLKQDRWVQCIAASNGGTHVAVGGVSSEISILDVSKGWDSVMGIELNGLVPLSAKWHPKDQYLALTGQNNSIVVVETTNARHVKGHHLHGKSSILAIEFSPDGRMAVVGNKDGVITFFSLSVSTFVTSYELVVPMNDRIAIQWSVNGLFIVIGCRDSVIVVGRKKSNRNGTKVPPKSSGLSVRKVLHDLFDINSVSIDSQCQYVAVSGRSTWILDATSDFTIVREWTGGPIFACEWSPDGRWLATIGNDKILTIYDTSEERVDRWRAMFSVSCDFVGRALAWGPLIVGGLLYLAYAGDGKEITIMEIRIQEGTWETVLRIQREGGIKGLDWNTDGLLAAAISNGTVSIVDLAYFMQSGVAVNEMDYNWQRQALTCFTEIRRNRGRNAFTSARWIPSAPGSDSLLAVGGTDGEVEIVDLTERQRCRGYFRRGE